MQPIHDLANIPKNTPIFFIHSKEDNQIPIDGSRNIYNTLVKLGYKYVHLYELEHGEHDQYATGSSQEDYRDALHAFYKKYNLPYHAEYAEQGKKKFLETQHRI
jgi:dipeptidyl aminopeptidase/acylaminoacyl peptidase